MLGVLSYIVTFQIICFLLNLQYFCSKYVVKD